MPSIRNNARLSAKTVSETPKHNNLTKKRRESHKPQPVRKLLVDPRIWRTALKLAKGDATRIKVINEQEVLVTNKSKKKAS